MRLASEPRNVRLPKLAARCKKVRNTAQGSLVGLCMQSHKSLCAAVTICSNLVNIQTDT